MKVKIEIKRRQSDVPFSVVRIMDFRLAVSIAIQATVWVNLDLIIFKKKFMTSKLLYCDIDFEIMIFKTYFLIFNTNSII